MNRTAIWKPVAPLAVRGPRTGISIRVKRAASLAVLMFAGLSNPAFAQTPCPGIHVEVLNIRNSEGSVACALFESADGFPVDYLRLATKIVVMKVRREQAHCDFEDAPPGTYAIAVVHDENVNGKLDTNWLGIPQEGYGFSNDARAMFGAPSFQDASFPYDGKNLNLTIKLRY